MSGASVHLATFVSSTGSPRLAVLTADQEIHVWDPVAGNQIDELRVAEADMGSRLVAWNTTSGHPRIAVTCGDAGIRIIDPEAGTQDGLVLMGHEVAVVDLATWFTPGGQPRLASSGDGVTLLWDPETGRNLGQLTGPDEWLNSITAHTSPERTLLVVIDEDGGYTLWDPQAEQKVASYRLPSGLEPGLGISLPGLRIATGHGDGTVRVTDPATGDQLHETRFRRPVRAIASLPDGMVIGLDDGWRMVRLPESEAA